MPRYPTWGWNHPEETSIGTLPELFQAFESQWTALWNRHAAVPESQWHQILEFAKAQLRPVSVCPPVYDVQSVKRTLQRKSKYAATSLDGVSRHDLLTLPEHDLGVLCKVYNQAMTSAMSGLWQKCQTPAKWDIFVRSRCFPTHIEPGPLLLLDTGSVQSVKWLTPFCAAIQLEVGQRWFGVTCWNSLKLHTEEKVTFADFQQILSKLSTFCPGSLHLQQSSFWVLTKAPLLDGQVHWVDLSGILWCVAIFLLVSHRLTVSQKDVLWVVLPCLLWHSCSTVGSRLPMWCLHRSPMLTTGEWFSGMCSPWDKLVMRRMHLRRLYNLTLTRRSPTAGHQRDSRRFLRGEGFAVRLHTKELGAHVVSSCQLSNFHALERFRQLADFWQKLTNSPCVYQQKVTLIMRVAWPRAFHGVSAVVIGRTHFDNLRTCIMQALKLQKPGANPELQCSLEGDLFDPLLYAAAETVRDARSLRDAQHVAVDLNLALFSDGKPAFNTLSEIVGQRLHKIGFEVQQDAQVRDSLGCFNLLSCPLAEFVMRAQWTWTKVLACKVKHRRSFLGFEHVDLISTRRAYKKYNPFDQGILRKYLHGAALANDQAQHWSHDGSQQCQQCGSLDSVRHRLWECPSTQPLREEIPEQVRIGLTLLPEVSLLHGWTLRSPLAEAWNKYLVDLPSQASFAVDFSPGGILDLFTDGSCLYPTVPELRMASWAVVRAPPFSLDFDKSQFVPIAAQPLHGLLQSAYRAELFAVCVARDFTIQCHACARVWSDCQSVLDAFQRYVKDNEAVKPNGLHSDLLLRLQDLAKQLGPHRLAMMKVPAHQQRSDAETDLESWLLDGNSVADTAVGVANQTRPPATWAFWNSYAEQLADNSHASWIRSHMLKVSKLWNHVVPPNVMPAPKPHKPVRHGRQHPEPAWDSSQGLSLRRPTFVRQFGSELASDVYSWLNRSRDPQQSPRYVSFIQLFLSFQRLHGPWHIAKVDGKWMAEKGHLASLANHCKLSVRVKHFRLMVQQYLKDAGVKYTCCTVRPRSDWILCFKGSIGFQSCDEEHKVIEGILATKLLAPATGDGASLESLRGVWLSVGSRSCETQRGSAAVRRKKHFLFSIRCGIILPID